MQNQHYAASKLHEAVYELARGSGNINERLYSAYLKFHPIQSTDLPDNLAEDYQLIMKRLTKYSSTRDDQGDVEHTLSRIRRASGVSIAEQIIRLESDLARSLNETAE